MLTYAIGELEVAVELRQHALQIVQARLGEEHPQVCIPARLLLTKPSLV